MSQTIDCLLIGHNEMNFVEYEKSIREMGIDSGAYQDLNKNFIRYNNVPYHISEIFNIFNPNSNSSTSTSPPLTMGDTFNLAIAYLGTYLQRRGLSFDYINAFQDEKGRLAEKLSVNNIRTIAIITTLYVSVFPILEIIDFIKKYNTTAKIIIGGPFIANQVRTLVPLELDYLFKSLKADFYVYSSQGETALVKIINALKNNSPLEKIENIYYQSNNGFLAAPRVKEDNRLSSNMVNWNLFSDRLHRYCHINIRTSISCPFSCAFCGFPQHAGQYQTAAVEEIQTELNQVNKIESIKSLHVTDDTFNVPTKRFKEILKMMVKNNYKFQWHSNFRCQFADREMVELMKASGCEGVFLGIESGSNRVLKIMNKTSTVEKYLEGIELLKQYDILTFGSFIIGFPGETRETVQETIKFIQESGIDFYRTQLWYCDTLTPIWQEKEKYRIQGSHFQWSHATFDSETASAVTDQLFCSIETPIWLPQYNFEFNGLFHLLHRGGSLDQVKNFIKAFNKGIKEKLTNPTHNDVGSEVIKELEESLMKTNHRVKKDKEKTGNLSEAGFDFDNA